jgi:inner membrane transporter RhtA
VCLLAGMRSGAEWTGVGFALAAAGLWAGYILLGKRVADTGEGLDSLAVGMAAAALVLGPALVWRQSLIDASALSDPRTWLHGAGVGVLSSAIPYALDQRVLATVGRARFAMLLALLPATAAVVGAVMLAQRPTIAEIAGIGLVMLALLVSAGSDPGSERGSPETPVPI